MLLGFCVDIISISNGDTMCKAAEVFNAISVSDSKTAVQFHSVCSHTQLLQCSACHSMSEIFIKVSLFTMLQGDLSHLLWFQSRYMKSQFKCEFHLCMFARIISEYNNK